MKHRGMDGQNKLMEKFRYYLRVIQQNMFRLAKTVGVGWRSPQANRAKHTQSGRGREKSTGSR